ncbi:MAG: aldolase [Rickettsiaceae bacterium]|jgi:hypothetical protein|nr:aldolase [Rickettsiaceae bacterium]
MTGMDDREKSYENKFAHDQELEFKMRAKRDKMLGLWAAERMRLDEDDSEDYASEVVDCGIGSKDGEAVAEKVLYDLRDAGVDISEEEVRDKMDELLTIAKDEEF